MAITAVPVGDSYVAPTGGVISGGRYRWPAWRRAIAKNTWGPVGAHTLSQIDPAQSPLFNPNYPSRAPWALTDGGISNSGTNNGVVLPWCGAVENLGKIHLPLGGGHGDYGGNEPYMLDLNADDPSWVMLRPPSGSVPLIASGIPAGATPYNSSYQLDDHLEPSGIYADGRPRAVHSYRLHAYVPGVGVVLPSCGAQYTLPWSFNRTMVMDVVTGEWDIKQQVHTGIGDPHGGASCYDSTRGYVLYHGAGNGLVLSKIDPLTGNRTAHGAQTIGSNGDVAIIYIKEFDIVFHACDYFARDFCIRDASSGAITQPLVTGVTPPSFGGGTGLAWVPGLGMAIQSGKSGGMSLLTPTGNPKTDPWECSILSTSAAPPDNTTIGMYSRFGYSEKLKGIYRVCQAGVPVWFYATEAV